MADNSDKTIEQIKSELSAITLLSGATSYTIDVGSYIIKVWTPPLKEIYLVTKLINDRITNYDKVDVSLYERSRRLEGNLESYINLEKDSRFINYKPIKYHYLAGYSSGDDMPIENLCELIRYLYRLSRLKAFW